MRKVNPDAKKAMKLMYSEKISLAEAWKRVKGGSKRKSKKSSRRRSSRRRLSRTKNSLKLNRKKMHRKSKRRSRKFGSESGPGYAGQTSYSNASAPYFNTSSPYVNPSEWYLPVTNGKVQSPQMLMKN